MTPTMRAMALVTPVLALAGWTASAADWPEIRGRGALRVLAVVANQQGEFFTETPGVGFDREILEGFASLHKLKLEVVPVPSWDGLVPALQQGKGDLIAGRFTVTKGRSELIRFTTEVFPTRSVVLTRKPHRVVRTLEEFRAEKVGTVKGTSMAEAVAAARVPPANVDDSLPTGTLPAALKAGKVTAVVLGIESAIAAQRQDPEIQLGLFLGSPGALAYGVRKEDAELLGLLNEYVGNLRRTPSWSRLVVKYFGESAPEILKRARAEQ
jgi:ABC-type amino acid transport substrate-binding protein